MISKIIWQTHEEEYNNLLPFQKNITNTWKNLNPGWEYRYVSAKERSIAVKKYDSFLYECYLKLDNVYQSDIWRLITIYNEGGFYADMDSMCIEAIETSINKNYKNQEIICSSIGFQSYGINNSNFGATKNNKIIKLIIDNIVLKYKEILSSTNYTINFPLNGIFSNTLKMNKDFIFFNNDYFLHSKHLKSSFYNNIEVMFNKEKIDYKTLCTNMNWPIYYI